MVKKWEQALKKPLKLITNINIELTVWERYLEKTLDRGDGVYKNNSEPKVKCMHICRWGTLGTKNV